MGQVLRFAVRQLLRSPGFATLAVAMLALGIGATTTIFSVINAVLFRPPAHVREPEGMVAVFTSDFSGPRFGTSSYPDFVDFAGGASGLEGLAAVSPRPFSVAAGVESFRAMGELVSENYFGVLGVPLAKGRGFVPGSETEVVIGHGSWQRRLGGAPDAVGRIIRLSGHTFTVVGVAPEGYTGAMRGIRTDAWVPLAAQRLLSPSDDMFTDRGDRGLFLLGRLRNGVSAAEAQSRLDVVAARLHRAYRERWTDHTGSARVVTVLPERDARIFPTIRGPVTRFLARSLGGPERARLALAHRARTAPARGGGRGRRTRDGLYHGGHVTALSERIRRRLHRLGLPGHRRSGG